MKAKFLVGVLIVVAVTFSAILFSGGKLLVFVDVATYLVIFFIPAGIAFASWPVRDIGRAFSAPFDKLAKPKELEKSLFFFESARRWILVSAFLGTMVGLVCILVYADATNLERLGRNLGVMLLCITNALFFFLLIPLPIESLAKRRLMEHE
jgi:flagellar motor component MotA